MAISSSPRGAGQSKTEIMLNALVKGMRDAGAEVQEVLLRSHKVHYCTGCYTCWTKTPGTCQIKDDMTLKLFPLFLASDIVVYATPLYHFTMNACMKAFIERTLPMVQPFLVEKSGRTSHPLRAKPPASVMLSVAGFPEISVFQHLSAHVRFMFGKGLLGEIYRPAAELLSNPAFKRTVADILDATTQAGRELVENSQIKPETMERITQRICDTETLRMLGDLMWKTCIAEGITTKEFQAKGMVPRPDSIASFLAVMKIGFNPKAAADTTATLQFTFTGSVEGSCHLIIDNGKIETHAGPAAKPDLIITAPFETWMDIITRKADGAQLFLEQKYSAEGNLDLLMNMARFFGA
jgi:multimeric flavodoxin WrbA/putative sterol carrier protein